MRQSSCSYPSHRATVKKSCLTGLRQDVGRSTSSAYSYTFRLPSTVRRHPQLDYNQTNPVWGESDAFVAAALVSSDAIVP